jgi:hypothetical protein
MSRTRTPVSRRALLAAGAASVGALPAAAQQPQRPRKPPLPDDLVREFVSVAHKDLDRVKELLAREPALLNAAWDWGGGDWETAMGAAGHTGGREIALLLLEKGARMDLFAAAMLGKLEIVKATLTAFPDLVDSRGPHGIPLLTHAKVGGEEAKPVLEYLKALRPEPPAK